MRIKSLVYASFFLFFFIFSCSPKKTKQEKLRELIREGSTAYSEQDYKKAIEYYKRAFEIDPTYGALVYNIACCYSILDEKEEAFNWLKKAIDLGVYEFESDPDFDNIREEPEFKKLVEEAGKLLEKLRIREWKPLVFLPDKYTPQKRFPLIIGLHGYGISPEVFSTPFKELLSKRGYIFICPYGPDVHGKVSFGWNDYNTSAKRVLEAIKEVEEKYSVVSEKIILFGYSQGGSRVLSIGLRYPEIFYGIISVAGSFDYEGLKDFLPKAGETGIKVYMMIGGKDRRERVESNIKAKEEMEKFGIPVHLEIYPDVGHAFPGTPAKELEKALAWIEFSD